MCQTVVNATPCNKGLAVTRAVVKDVGTAMLVVFSLKGVGNRIAMGTSVTLCHMCAASCASRFCKMECQCSQQQLGARIGGLVGGLSFALKERST